MEEQSVDAGGLIEDRLPDHKVDDSEYVPWGLRAGFFSLGLINNLAYCVVIGGASNIVEDFDSKNNIGFLVWANVALGIVARVVNVSCMLHIPTAIRMIGVVAFLGVGLSGVFLTYLDPTPDTFWATVGSVVCIGVSCSLGESVLLGYMPLFPDGVVGYWSSGTGMSGVVGTLVYAALRAAGLSDKIIFLMLIPLVALYTMAFMYVRRFERDPDSTRCKEESLEPPTEYTSLNSEPERTEAFCGRLCRCVKIVLGYSLNLMFVYFFEYVISVGLAARANSKGTSSLIPSAKPYVILAFCYQFGVLISRSSLSFVQIKKVTALTVLQGFFFVLWTLQDLCVVHAWTGSDTCAPLGLQYAHMVAVGLLGGAAYVNIFHNVLTDSAIPEPDREFCVNVCSIFINAGIVLSSLYDIVMDNTFVPSNKF